MRLPKKTISKTKINSFWLFGIILGLLLIFTGLKIQNVISAPFFGIKFNKSNEINKSQNPPIRIIVPGANINLEIVPTRIIKNQWEIVNNSANFLATSASPGEKGKIIIYGHNTNRVFGRLHQLKINDYIELWNIEGKKFSYRVNNISVVNSNNAQIISSTNYETLIVYTCTGFFDSQRLVIEAKPFSTN